MQMGQQNKPANVIITYKKSFSNRFQHKYSKQNKTFLRTMCRP